MTYMHLRQREQQRKHRRSLITGIAAMAAFICLLGLAGEEDRKAAEPIKATAPIKPLTAEEQKIATALYKAGSDRPVEIAKSISTLKRKKLATAVAIVETQGRDVRGAAGEKGVWQIIEREHGIVPDDIQGQAQKFEEVMEGYIRQSDGKLAEACRRYNSGRSNRSYAYSAKVMALVAKL